MDHHDKGHSDDTCDRCDVADKIEIKFLIERGIHRIRRSDQKERVAVRRRPHDGLGADVGAGTRSVLDNELLAKPL